MCKVNNLDLCAITIFWIELTMSSGRSAFGGRGGGGHPIGRGRGRGGGAANLEEPLPRRPGLHFHRELALPLGDRTR